MEKKPMNAATQAWYEWEHKQNADWIDVSHSDSFFAGFEASEAHYEYQERQSVAAIATLKAGLELAESELKMLYKKTGVSGERILRVIEVLRI